MHVDTRSERFVRYRAWYASASRTNKFIYEFLLPVLLFASVGAITWAIRGTNGWGGIDGTVVPGLTWGLLWYYLCHRKGIDARGIVLWLGMGIALGGELGYGQYVSWIRGTFNVGDEVIPISPWTGYLWFLVCGIGWGAPGGIVLGWALNSRVSVRQWVVRAALMVILFLLLFNLGGLVLGKGIIEWLGDRLVRWCPGLLFPNADQGIYAGELGKHLSRTVYTNTQNCCVLLWWVTAMLVAVLQRDRHTLFAGTVIGGGFGPGFALAAAWCHGYSLAPKLVDWWKVWEMQSGFNLGLLYAIVLYRSMRHVDSAEESGKGPTREPTATKRGVLLTGLAGFVLVFAAGYEYFFWLGLAVAAVYLIAMVLAIEFNPIIVLGSIVLLWMASDAFPVWARAVGAGMFVLLVVPGVRKENPEPDQLTARVRGVSLVYSVFLLFFILLHGATSRAGVVLGIYGDDAIGQYEWPPGRIALLVPALVILAGVTIWAMRKVLKYPMLPASAHLPVRMYDLLTIIGVVGAISIWPAKIGALYALLLALGVFSLSRLNRGFDAVDTGQQRLGNVSKEL